MPASGTFTCSNPSDYAANFRNGGIELVFAHWGEFRARLTWVELSHLHLLRIQESLPRIAYVSLASERIFIGFPAHPDPLQIWGGVELQSGDIILHARGDHFHQRTNAPSRWGFVSVAPEQLAAYGKALAGVDLIAPPVARILRPPVLAKARMLRLHAQACRLAETKPEMIAHREVARALEQDLLHALVTCLAAAKVRDAPDGRQRNWGIMRRFEEALAVHRETHLRIADVCSTIGVSERVLRTSCADVLGMGPRQYLRLRRLNLVRAALRNASPSIASIAEIARRYGFPRWERFAALYRLVFGETPLPTYASHAPRDADCPK